MTLRQKALAAIVLPAVAALTGSSAFGADSPDPSFSLMGAPRAAIQRNAGQQDGFERPFYLQAGVVPPGAVVSGLNAAEPTTPTQETQTAPLMSLLNQVGVGDWLTQNRINVYGWIEGSYTHNFENPRSPELNSGRLFDVQDNNILLNQFDLTFERTVDLKAGHFDVGGRVDLLYGSDARFIHSSGMFDSEGAFSPQYQFDIPQVYVDFALPVGNGLRVRVGKFQFLKPTDPNLSPFYSHTFSYAFAGGGLDNAGLSARLANTLVGANLPYSLTGISGYYEFSKQVNAEVGISRGYDQSLKDNNGAINAFGRFNYILSEATTLSFALIVGPEIADDNSHYRSVGDISVIHSVTNDLTLLLNFEYGYQARPDTLEGVPVGGDARWYGVSGAAVYRINTQLSAALRGEWYRDEDGFTSGHIDPTTGLPDGQHLYAVTAGVTITPFPDSRLGAGLKIRPEIRYDYSDKAYFITHGDSLNHGQLTVAVDVIYNF